MALSRMALDWSNATVSMKLSLSRSISLMPAIMRFSSYSFPGYTFFVTLASSKMGFQVPLFPPFFLPPIQISNIIHECTQPYLILIIEVEVFQMKKCRQKAVCSQKLGPVVDGLCNGYSNAGFSKLFVGHNKTIANPSFHNVALAQGDSEKKSKNKRKSNSTAIQNPVQVKKNSLNSKSNRKRKQLELPLNLKNQANWVEEKSYREYCVVDEHFVGISSKDEQKLVHDFFSKTASTSYDFSQLNILSDTKHQLQQRAHLKKRSISNRKENGLKIEENEIIIEENKMVIRKQDKAVSNAYVRKVYANAQIEAITQSCQVGMQYSQRKPLIEQKQVVDQQKTSDSFKLNRLTQSIQENIASSQQSLSDILFKIEFTHLIDDKSFSTLTQNQKAHFSQLLQTVLARLSHKKQKNSKQRVNVLFEQTNERQQENIIEKGSSQSQKFSNETISRQVKVNFQKLEELITRRQWIQNNIIQDNAYHATTINTSLLAVLNFLGQFLCFIELQNSQQFIHMISKMYGLGFRQKYRRISRNLPLNHEIRFRIIDEALFLDFINQSDDNIINNYEIAHFKAIFDALNQHLEAYRPCYAGNGQQFPWAFKLFTNMSQYSIDQDSLQILFRQVKEKIAQQVQILCGLLVQYDEPLPLKNPLELKRLQKESIFIQSFVKEQNFEKDEIQLFATQALHNISEEIWHQLIQQLAEDSAFLFT